MYSKLKIWYYSVKQRKTEVAGGFVAVHVQICAEVHSNVQKDI